MIKWLKCMFKDFPRTQDGLRQLAAWTFDDPEKLSYWLEHHVSYKPDRKNKKENYENYFEAAWVRRECDCEEYALLAQAVAEMWMNPYNDCNVFEVHKKDKAHAVCVIIESHLDTADEKQHIISTFGYSQIPIDADFAPEIYPDWTMVKRVDEAGNTIGKRVRK